MRQPRPSDFVVEVTENRASVVFKPKDRQYIFGRLEDPEDIAQFGSLSRVLDEPSQSTGETGEYSEDEVARMAHTLAVKAVTTT
jgi:hypothetical protein